MIIFLMNMFLWEIKYILKLKKYSLQFTIKLVNLQLHRREFNDCYSTVQ